MGNWEGENREARKSPTKEGEARYECPRGTRILGMIYETKGIGVCAAHQRLEKRKRAWIATRLLVMIYQ